MPSPWWPFARSSDAWPSAQAYGAGPSFLTGLVRRNQAEYVAESQSKGGRVGVLGRLPFLYLGS